MELVGTTPTIQSLPPFFTNVWFPISVIERNLSLATHMLFTSLMYYAFPVSDETLRSRCISMIQEQKKLKEVLKVNDK